MEVCLLFLWLVVVVDKCWCTLSPEDKRDKVLQSLPGGPVAESVYDKGLVTSKMTWKDLVFHHAQTSREGSAVKRLPKETPVLAYITPWNSKGFPLAVKNAKKLDYVSPVWFEVTPNAPGSQVVVINGEHNINKNWIAQLRNANPDIKVVPRYHFTGDAWTSNIVASVFEDKQAKQLVSDIILNHVQRNKFDGFVLDFWYSFAPQQTVSLVFPWLNTLANELKRRDIRDAFIAVAPPLNQMLSVGPPNFSKDVMGELRKTFVSKKAADGTVEYFGVTKLSMMFYDFSGYGNPGPNAPYQWIEKGLQHLGLSSSGHRPKDVTVFMGLNFYGYDFTATGGSPVLGENLVRGLQQGKKQKVLWDEDSQEHFFIYKDSEKRSHTVFYPTPYSIDVRLKLAQSYDVGVSIWEFGQGLDFFMDLF